MLRIICAILLLNLSGCGMKGSLLLPPGPTPEPLLGYPKPAAKPAKRPDVSTDAPSESAPDTPTSPIKPE